MFGKKTDSKQKEPIDISKFVEFGSVELLFPDHDVLHTYVVTVYGWDEKKRYGLQAEEYDTQKDAIKRTQELLKMIERGAKKLTNGEWTEIRDC